MVENRLIVEPLDYPQALKHNIQDFAETDLQRQIAKNPRIFDLLQQMIDQPGEPSIMLEGEVCLFRKDKIMYDGRQIGTLTLEIPVEDPTELAPFHTAVESFLENIAKGGINAEKTKKVPDYGAVKVSGGTYS